jgi:hypothetical protein
MIQGLGNGVDTEPRADAVLLVVDFEEVEGKGEYRLLWRCTKVPMQQKRSICALYVGWMRKIFKAVFYTMY